MGKPAHKNIVLTGFMGTGKSTVGRLLAIELGRDFVDTDNMIVSRHGPIAEIFADHGEAHFRSIERDLARELAAQVGLVVATGGGMLLQDEVGEALAGHQLFCLTAPADVIVARVLADSSGVVRPLLAGPDAEANAVQLLTERALRYRMFEQVDTDGLTPAQVVAEIRRRISPAADNS
ncbi:MAG: shikimate kinase [Acidimicrobiales bacterium]|nr:shikimate kinase [Acidimicrobiales bacterium]MDG2217850.1 shikimate kinase [Acidimicrobiales bacterium]